MKRMIALCLVFAFLFAFASSAEYFDEMAVVNCEEWVSLREEPDTKSKRIEKVMLGDTITNCMRFDEEWYYAEYNGKGGYILSQYLVPVNATGDLIQEPEYFRIWPDSEDFGMNGTLVFSKTIGDVMIVAERIHDRAEILRTACFEADGVCRWGIETVSYALTELSNVHAFMAGTDMMPMVGIYNAEIGLTMVDAYSGITVWELPSTDINLGGSISAISDEWGNMYITGFYGPDPVCISADGSIRWRSAVEDTEVYWPYDMALTEDMLFVRYDSINAWIAFDLLTGEIK
ncbi:MAG: hypothetical protein IJC48_11085 [Clostridia bacterium]|nr:hypothetical protein [Clostridia bacterium]MBQ4157178.1 hypothetical protein [Clostridia bacterium]